MSENKNSLTSFVLGVIAGAAITYLYSNEKGEKIRERLMQEGSKLLEKITEGLEEVEEDLEKGKDKLASGATEAKEAIAETVAQVPQQVERLEKKTRHFFFKKPPKPQES